MRKATQRPRWLLKRLVLPVLSIVALAGAFVVAVIRADHSSIVIYNETGEPLSPLMVRACGQTKVFPDMQDQDSVRMELEPSGGETAVHLELADVPVWTWDGGYVKPRGGYRLSIRLEPDHQVDVFSDYSWWRRTFWDR